MTFSTKTDTFIGQLEKIKLQVGKLSVERCEPRHFQKDVIFKLCYKFYLVKKKKRTCMRLK